MGNLYQEDLAYIQACGFGDFAHGSAEEIVRVLGSGMIPVRRVVDVGCGAGPLTAVLVIAGFQVTGIDVSEELLRLARAAIVAIGEPLTYHEDDDGDSRVREFFRRAADVLPQGGMLIFDLIELGQPSLSARSWKSGNDWAVLVETKEDQSTRTLVREIETFRKVREDYRRGREAHRVRLFDAAEVCGWLEEAGFRVSTAASYGAFWLPPRRRAFFCTRR